MQDLLDRDWPLVTILLYSAEFDWKEAMLNQSASQAFINHKPDEGIFYQTAETQDRTC